MTNTDNMGKLLASIITIFQTGSFSKNVVLVDEAGNNRTLRSWGTNAQVNFNTAIAGFVQVGEGVTPATRQDFKLEDPFSNGGVEDAPVLNQVFGYNSGLGKVTVATMITPTAGSGTITEVIHFGNFKDTANITIFVLTQRDVISPTNFITGETIDVEHIWLI